MAGAERRILPYPWGSLGRVSRFEARRLPEARGWLDRALRLDRLADALGSVASGETQVAVRSLRVVTEGPSHGGLPVRLATADGTARLVVAPAPALAALLVARALGRRVPIVGAVAPTDPALEGALAAVLLEIARRAGGEVPLVLLDASTRVGYPLAHVALTVVVDGQPHGADVFVELPARPTAGLPAGRALASLGAPLTLGVVGAISVGAREELAALRPGAAWMPGEGWLVRPDGTGPVLLAPAASSRGLRAELGACGSVAPTRAVVDVPWVDEDGPSVEPGATPSVRADPLESVVVRVELGQVTLEASAWAALIGGAGADSALRARGPVILRAGGHALARGELVRLGGELGVRIVAREA